MVDPLVDGPLLENRPTRPNFDRLLLVSLALLCLVGLLMIYSASTLYSDRLYGSSWTLLKNQLMHLAVGLGLMGVVMRIPHPQWKELVPLLLVVCFVLMALVLVPKIGHDAGRGARRWLRVGGFSLQPVELVKIVLIVFVASTLDRKQNLMENFVRGVAPNFVVMGVFLVMLLAQPDFGSMVLITTSLLLMIFVGGARIRHVSASLAVMGVVGGYLVATQAYRLKRVLAFLDPWADRQNSGFQVVQSFLAFGNGGVLGQGIGASRQKMLFLPDAHTDFIMSIVAEETGLLGVTFVLTLLTVFLWRCFSIALACPDRFGRFMGFGLASCLTLQTLINLGVVTGMLPTKGLPMPFISYGGSSLVATLLMAGLLLSIGRHRPGAAPKGPPAPVSRPPAQTIRGRIVPDPLFKG
ncbi:MAG: putative lipid II flippase FtsW [Deltaproteobacteria bacterium]|nr:putative lipid II flippase FtsW [Deltaproteobacteria bacterium]